MKTQLLVYVIKIDTACVEVGYLSMQTVVFDIYITSAK